MLCYGIPLYNDKQHNVKHHEDVDLRLLQQHADLLNNEILYIT